MTEWTPDDATRHIERLRVLLTEREADVAALRWVLGVVDGDPVSASPLPERDEPG